MAHALTPLLPTIYAAIASGMSAAKIAEQYNVSRSHVYNLKKRLRSEQQSAA